MKKNLKDSITEFEEFIAAEPTTNQKAWGIIHDFYHLLLTYMDGQGITRAELARRTGKSRSAISQMFNKTPNLTIIKMVEISDAVGLEFSLTPIKRSKKDKISRTSSLPEYPQRITPRMEVNEEETINDKR
jgi:transcriptional regulator with XRE-family HTH domain